MNKIGVIKLSAVLLLVAATATAQRKKSRDSDTLSAYREFVSLGKWYLNTPLQLKIHFVTQTRPAVGPQDHTETDMLLYYGQRDFYLQAGELEQIVNDSLTVLVNSEAKMIQLFSNKNVLSKTMERIIPGLVPDDSLQELRRQYAITIEQQGKDLKQMVVQSRDTIYGTDVCKERVVITYQSDSYQPVNYFRTQRSLVAIDSTVYMQMTGNPAHWEKMISASTTKGELFFVMIEKITECRFTEVSHTLQPPPALLQQRIVRTETGDYIPAKGFEDYLVSKEF